MPHCLLVDNGSVKAASIRSLRRIAAALEAAIDEPVAPVSVLHSNRVDPVDLDGVPAEILEPAFRRRLEGGILDFVVVPLFFGPSRAVTDHIPGKVRALRKEFPALEVRLAKPLFDPGAPADERLAAIVRDRVEEVWPAGGKPSVVLVDHGSPVPEVTRVRDRVAGQLGGMLPGAARVAAASMERRGGERYAFNEPLLERILRRDGFNSGTVVAAMLFLSPGRHAGPGGDVDRICREAERARPGLKVIQTGLVGDHPGLIDILADRFRAALDSPMVGA